MLTCCPQKSKEDGAAATADGEHLKRVFARQRAKDLAEHAKSMLTKDREIEDLRKKCQELADQLSNGDLMAPQVGGVEGREREGEGGGGGEPGGARQEHADQGQR